MIAKKITLRQASEWDEDSGKSHPALVVFAGLTRIAGDEPARSE
jgi:hypothetical protein